MAEPEVEADCSDELINRIIENVFRFTLNKDTDVFTRKGKTKIKSILYMGEIDVEGTTLTIENFPIVLFERLMLLDPASHMLSSSHSHDDGEAACNDPIAYLFRCYYELVHYTSIHGEEADVAFAYINRMREMVANHVAVALKEPDAFVDHDVFEELFKLLCREMAAHHDDLVNFLNAVVTALDDGDFICLHRYFNPMMNVMLESIRRCSITLLPTLYLDVLELISSVPEIARATIKYRYPTSYDKGGAFCDTIFGSLLAITAIPQPNSTDDWSYSMPPEEFLAQSTRMWDNMERIRTHIHRVMLKILKRSPELRAELLEWLGYCMSKNGRRRQEYNNATYRFMSMFGLTQAEFDDGFALNLASVMLKFAMPVVQRNKGRCSKVVKVDPTYCAVESKFGEFQKGVHLCNLYGETCLVPVAEGEKRLLPSGDFSFVTECFYMTHYALSLGLKVSVERLITLNMELSRMQSLIIEANEMNDALMKRQLGDATKKYYGLRSSILEPTFISEVGTFFEGTCEWLLQLLMDPDTSDTRESFAPGVYREFDYDGARYPDTLKCVPEMIFDNICSFLTLLQRFEPSALSSPEALYPMLTTLIKYMSSKQLVRNPHLRAQLADAVDCLLPSDEMTDMPSTSGSRALSQMMRKQLFLTHPHRKKIIPSLLDIFVGIEMTGESVQFDQKFNYKRPMYDVMEYLWEIEEQRAIFVELADDAMRNMEAVDAPIFLRFINVLINDATFLLDEAISSMAKIKQMRAAMQTPEWNNLPQNERRSQREALRSVEMMAKFGNMLGMYTISLLERLTEEIQNVFCHLTIVDRVAAMLNYFLMMLVGPKSKNLKVKNVKNDYKFKPGEIVCKICSIYIHLGSNDEFCAAVSRDGRSYNPRLFKQAENVLVRVQGAMLVNDLLAVAERVTAVASQQKTDEELLSEAPDDYLDPIMSTLMLDPVILPSSRKIVDRATIARHLLSDQTDPFNREPLTMDQIVPDTKLKAEIDEWIRTKRTHVAAEDEVQSPESDTQE